MRLFLASCVVSFCLPLFNVLTDVAAVLLCRDLRDNDKGDAFVSISFADAI